MIPRVALDAPKSLYRSGWPDPPTDDPRSPYDERPSLRTMRIFVDAEVYRDAGNDPWSSERLLNGILDIQPYLAVCRYHDEGPPADALWRNLKYSGRAAEGWITMLPDPNIDQHGFVFSYSRGNPIYTAYKPSTAAWISHGTHTSAYETRDPGEAHEQKRRDGIAAAVALTIAPDFYVTHREHLIRHNAINGLTTIDLDGCLAVLGLYLRSQGDFRIWFDPDGEWTFTLGKRFYYETGAIELLPNVWRWGRAINQHIVGRKKIDDPLGYLVSSMWERLVQVLAARDDVHRALNRPQTPTVAHDAISALEMAALMMMAAVDVMARVTHDILQVPGHPSSAAWQHDDWINKIRASCPALADLVDKKKDNENGTRYTNVLTILRCLRNSIHAVRPHPMSVRTHPRRSDGTVMSLPRAQQQQIVEAMDRLGGRTAWGVENIRQGEFHVDPGTLLERLLLDVLDLLNAIMGATPVEKLAHVNLRSVDLVPPDYGQGGPVDRYSTAQRSCVRRLLGL